MPETTPPVETLNLSTTIEFAEDDAGSSPINLDTGEFPMTLVTQGENSHGAILNIAGANSAPRVPLLLDHVNSALANVGSITNIRPTLRGRMPILRAIGRLELQGEGTQAEIRRDLAQMIAKKHLRAVSIGIQGDKVVARADLPSDHYAYVAPDEKDFAKRFGLYFEKFTVLEGSLVAVGADKRAIINRADLAAPVSEFWTSFLGDVETLPETIETLRKGLTETMNANGQALVDEIVNAAQEKQHAFSQVTSVRLLEQFLRDVGASTSEAKRIVALCKAASPPRDVESNQPTPANTLTLRDVVELIREREEGREERLAEKIVQVFMTIQGRVH